MINKFIFRLNNQTTKFAIHDLYEERDIDYLLISIDSLLAVVEVDYSGDISFKRISKDKRTQILQIFSLRLNTIQANEILI